MRIELLNKSYYWACFPMLLLNMSVSENVSFGHTVFSWTNQWRSVHEITFKMIWRNKIIWKIWLHLPLVWLKCPFLAVLYHLVTLISEILFIIHPREGIISRNQIFPCMFHNLTQLRCLHAVCIEIGQWMLGKMPHNGNFGIILEFCDLNKNVGRMVDLKSSTFAFCPVAETIPNLLYW